GETSSEGTSPSPVEGPARRADPPVLESDRSRPARSPGSLDWQCPFPEEADIDHAVSTIRVDVDARGSIAEGIVVDDPGSGLGREALACARRRHWESARDRHGSPIAGSVILRVRFDR